TLGQGITKLHLLQRLDWNPEAHRKAWWSRVLVTTGLASAGLPALGTIADGTALGYFGRFPVNILLIAGGLIIIAWGVRQAIHAVGSDIWKELKLPGAGEQFSWTDYWASADLVSNGGLFPGPDGVICMPQDCNEVYNNGPLLTDHNSSLDNQEQVLP